MSQKGLGRGLSALFDDQDLAAEDYKGGPQTALVTDLSPSPYQPRQFFDSAKLMELAESIKTQGVLQPLLVRPASEGVKTKYEIIAGERRWRAAQQARVHEVPILVREIANVDAAEIALLENVQREDLSIFEEAEGYKQLIGRFGYSQSDVADRIGKSRAHVANVLRLLAMPEALKQMVEQDLLTPGHARAMLSLENPMPIAKQAATENWSVRQVEEAVRKATADLKDPRGTTKPETIKDPDLREAEEAATASLGLAVQIQGSATKGSVKVSYASLEQLELILNRLSEK